jgi:hypothetical protein
MRNVRHNPWMFEPGQDVGFAQEAVTVRLVPASVVQHLQRDNLIRRQIRCSIDRTHATSACDSVDGKAIRKDASWTQDRHDLDTPQSAAHLTARREQTLISWGTKGATLIAPGSELCL